MSHSPVWTLLNKGLRLALDKNYSRRKFIKHSIAGTSALMLPISCANKKVKISVIGAGLAGLNTGLQLRNNNVDFKIYEATGRTGGRTLTINQAVTDDTYVDFGAEYVDSNHEEVISLAKQFNLELIDLSSDQLIPKTLFFGGQHLSAEKLAAAIQPYAAVIGTDIDSLPAELH